MRVEYGMAYMPITGIYSVYTIYTSDIRSVWVRREETGFIPTELMGTPTDQGLGAQ
jgi:hypothetical protein